MTYDRGSEGFLGTSAPRCVVITKSCWTMGAR